MSKTKLYVLAGIYAALVMVIAHAYVASSIAQRERFIRAETLMDESIRVFSKCQADGAPRLATEAPDVMNRLIHIPDERPTMVVDVRCMMRW